MTEYLKLTTPPQLAKGSFHPATGAGCIMNLMCWTKQVPADMVTDEVDSFHSSVREQLIYLNDTMCLHTRMYEVPERSRGLAPEDVDLPDPVIELNCPSCSNKLLDWAFALDNTSFIRFDIQGVGRRENDYENKVRFEALIHELDELTTQLRHFTNANDALDESYAETDYDRLITETARAFAAEKYSFWDHASIEGKLSFERFRNSRASINWAYYDHLLTHTEGVVEQLIEFVVQMQRKYGILPTIPAVAEPVQLDLDKVLTSYGIHSHQLANVPNVERRVTVKGAGQ